jgi:hypothetical protein
MEDLQVGLAEMLDRPAPPGELLDAQLVAVDQVGLLLAVGRVADPEAVALTGGQLAGVARVGVPAGEEQREVALAGLGPVAQALELVVAVGRGLQQDQRVRVVELDGVDQRRQLALEVGVEGHLRSVHRLQHQPAGALELLGGIDGQAAVIGAEGAVMRAELIGRAEADLLQPAAVGDLRLELKLGI